MNKNARYQEIYSSGDSGYGHVDSGYGHSGNSYASPSYGGYCPEGVPVEFALLSILAAFGVAFGILYRALTLITGGRRRKRDVGPIISENLEISWKDFLGDYLWHGKFKPHVLAQLHIM